MSKINFDVRQIRDAYPNPVEYAKGDLSCSYCVGGAFVMYVENLNNEENLSELYRFPSEASLRVTCEKLNFSTDKDVIDAIVSEIVTQNDAGNFESAWNWLDNLIKKLAQESD